MTDSDYTYVDSTGLIVPDTSTVLSEVQSEWKATFGNDMVVTTDTPQGVMISAETLARDNVLKNNAAVANQINPNVAGGIFLDAILALTGMERTKATHTIVEGVTLTGIASTVIPQGSQVKTATGDVFETISEVTLNSAGSAAVDFRSVETGPVPCAAEAFSVANGGSIVTGVIGWDTVDNGAAGILGLSTQSDQSARALRQNTLAFNGISLVEAITSALYAVEGVTSLKFQENTEATTETINGISMVAHSIYACVHGGSDTDVAAALLENKASGAAWNGDTTVNLIEPASGQTYPVKFDRPEEIGILIKATVSNVSAQSVQQALLDYAAGNIDGLPGFIVGGDVSPFELSSAILYENPKAIVTNVQICLSTADPIVWTNTPISIEINEIANTQLSYITVILS